MCYINTKNYLHFPFCFELVILCLTMRGVEGNFLLISSTQAQLWLLPGLFFNYRKLNRSALFDSPMPLTVFVKKKMFCTLKSAELQCL